MEGRVLTCVYCGHEYPQETPSWGNEVLTEHIRVCPKHPMRKAEADMTLLRNALAGLVGASDKAELEQMELAVRVLPAPDADKIASLNAIHALLATLPNSELDKSRPPNPAGGDGMGLEDIKKAWNEQADEYNQWDTLDADERVEFALAHITRQTPNHTTARQGGRGRDDRAHLL